MTIPKLFSILSLGVVSHAVSSADLAARVRAGVSCRPEVVLEVRLV